MYAVRGLAMLLLVASVALVTTEGHAREIQAGPIWNDMDARNKCPRVCQQNGDARWSGQWHTLPGTATSVCDCVGGTAPPPAPGSASPGDKWREAGPLFSQFDAQNKCPGVCEADGRAWDGNWKTTVPGRMSVCGCERRGVARSSGAGAACSASGRGSCAGCSVQCGPGQRASCQEGSTWNDRLRNGDMGCAANAKCTCG